tara:strand:- start:1795 stop:6495 length:4701 start_codon:yes stop_codon:yes gene_type:complete
MAIQFARCQIVKRSEGGNSCRSASYNGRSMVKDERTGNFYYFSDRVDNAHHEVMLPKGANTQFRDSAYLWNAVERAEKRLDAQVAKELVLALPDDKNIGNDFRIEFAQRFVKENFVDKGLAAQIDIHAPHGEKENNWHAHILVTTRRFSDCGTKLNRLKARDLNGTFYKGKVMEGDLWGEISRDLQNKMFEEKGMPNRVDPLGIIPQEHLGPVRMRNIENDALQRAEIIKEANEEASKDPEIVLEHLMNQRSTFSKTTLDWFIGKHVLEEERAGVKEAIMGHKGLMPLYDRESGEKTGFFTTKHVRSEEEKLVRFAESIDKSHSKTSIVQELLAQRGNTLNSQQDADQILQGAVAQTNVPEKQLLKDLTKDYSLTKGQRAAFESVVGEKRGLHIIRGRAGVGKSTVLSPICDAYQKAGYQVVGLAPTHKASNNLKRSGFDVTMTAHKFVFAVMNNKLSLPSKSLIVIDEAGMIGTEHYVELMNAAKQFGSKVLLVGDERQLASIQRGDMFEELAQRHGSVLIDEIKRQQDGWQKDVAINLADGKFDRAVRVLDQEGKIHWDQDKNGAKTHLMEDWSKDVRSSIGQGEGVGNRFILATRNADVDSLNIAARDLMKEWGLVAAQDYEIRNDRGKYLFAAGDHIQFAVSDKDLGIVNGWTGKITSLNETQITIKLDNGKDLTFDPAEYQGLRYGYAGTVYKSQGATLDKTYILHDRVGDAKNNYVALTRFAKDIGVYVNKDETKSLDHYISQISKEDGRGASLRYATLEEVQRDSKDLTFKDKVVDTLKGVKTKIGDTFHSNREFYNLGPKAEADRHEVTKAEKSQDFLQKEQEKDVKENLKIDTNKSSEKIDAKAVERAQKVYENSSSSSYQIDYKEVRDHLSVNIEGYARSLLGNETKRLSHAREMVWDQKGSKVSMNRRTGQWQDFKSGEKGDLIGLTSYVKGGEKHEAYRYAADYLGLKDSNRIDSTQNLLKEKIASKQDETDKLDQQKLEKGQAQVDQLVRLSQPIKGSLAEQYLRSHRGIKEADLGTDLRFLPISQKDQVYKPGLLSIARDKDNEITACQVTYLDPKTGNKATDIKVNKRTFGKISGSFVEIQKSDGSCKDKVYVAEGVETALSLKEAGIKGHIVAGLGLHNLDKADYFGKDIVIVGDNDGKNSQTQQRIEKVIQSYGEKYINITLAQPDRIGQDFNDVLKESGTEAVEGFFRATIHNNNQQELRDGDKTHNPTTYIGSPSQEKPQLEEGGNNFIQNDRRKNSQATSQNQSQESSRDSSVEEGYRNILKGAYQKMYGSSRSYTKVINKEVQEAVKEHNVLKYIDQTPSTNYAKTKLLSIIDYRQERYQEHLEDFKSYYKDLRYNWMRGVSKVERLSNIESRLYKESGFKENKNYEDKALHEAERNNSKIEELTKGFIKQGMFDDKAQLKATLMVEFKEKYGQDIPDAYKHKFEEMVNQGHSCYVSKMIKGLDKINPTDSDADKLKEYVNQGAFYLARRESFVKLEHAIGTSKSLTQEQEKLIPSSIQKDFNRKDDQFMEHYDQQKEVERQEKREDVQQHQQSQKTRDRGGMEM